MKNELDRINRPHVDKHKVKIRSKVKMITDSKTVKDSKNDQKLKNGQNVERRSENSKNDTN